MKNIYTVFDELGIEFKLYEHEPFFTCEDADAWYAEHVSEPSGESKNLLLRDKKGTKYYLAVVESQKQVDLKHLASNLGGSKLSFASPERLKTVLNLSPGSVSVLALIYEGAKEVTVLFDEDLLLHESLHYHPPGRNDQTLLIQTKDLKRFLEWTGNPIQIMPL